MTGRSRISPVIDELFDASQGLEPGLALLQKLGIGFTDLRSIPLRGRNESIPKLSNEDLDGVQRLLKQYGIKVAGLSLPLFKCPLRGSAGPDWGGHHHMDKQVSYRHYLDALPRAFALADRFETENIRCFAFWREYPFEEVFNEVVDKLGHAASLAQAAGHKLYLENEMNTLAGTGIEQARLLAAVNSPSLVGIYDEGNSARIGGIPFPDDYQALRGRIGHVHIKHRRLNVLCGWMSPACLALDQGGGYKPYIPWRHSPEFVWQQPNAPMEGELTIGNKTFRIRDSQTVETVTHSVVDYYRPLLQSLKRDGYQGMIGIDNQWDGPTKRGPQQRAADLETEIEALTQLIDEVWAAPV
jgi:sugar phosphate isomerase/epimerase